MGATLKKQSCWLLKFRKLQKKKEFQKLMAVLLQNEIFPETLTTVLKQHLKNKIR